MEMKQVTQSGAEAKTAVAQQPNTKEFKKNLPEF